MKNNCLIIFISTLLLLMSCSKDEDAKINDKIGRENYYVTHVNSIGVATKDSIEYHFGSRSNDWFGRGTTGGGDIFIYQNYYTPKIERHFKYEIKENQLLISLQNISFRDSITITYNITNYSDSTLIIKSTSADATEYKMVKTN